MKINLDYFMTATCVFAILYILLSPNLEERFQNEEVLKEVDDKFTDDLDHKYGLNKQHRHHSF